MFASVAAGVFPSLVAAQQAMCPELSSSIVPMLSAMRFTTNCTDVINVWAARPTRNDHVRTVIPGFSLKKVNPVSS